MLQNKYSHRPYEVIFPSLYGEEEARLKSVFGNQVQIEHFGSTAVPGLGGKGIIDIYVKAPKSELENIAELTKKLGYEHREQGDRDGRRFFRLTKNDADGNTRTFHLHLTDHENQNFEQSIAMRDYLRGNPTEARLYEEIKIKAAKEALRHNLYEAQKKAYQEAKSDYLDDLKVRSWNWWKNKGT